MTDLDQRLARVLSETVPKPPCTLDAAAIREGASRRRTRRSHRLAPALAAAAVVAVTAGVLLSQHQPAPRRASPEQRSSAVSPRTATQRVVERLLAAAPIVPGATPVGHSPTKPLDQPMFEPGSPNVISRTRWWTAPGTPDALQFFRTHLPAGVTPGGSSSTGGRGPNVQGLFFDASGPQWRRPAVYTELALLVSVTPLGNGTAIRVDAQAIWLPQHTADEQIPLSVTSVEVVVDRRGSAATVRRQLDASDARSLAAVVNHLAVSTSGIFHCPMDRGFTDTLTFHDTRGEIVVRADVGGCTPVKVLINGNQRVPTLQGGALVDHAVTKALGLPRSYGQ
jgi:hypothetical protein